MEILLLLLLLPLNSFQMKDTPRSVSLKVEPFDRGVCDTQSERNDCCKMAFKSDDARATVTPREDLFLLFDTRTFALSGGG